MHYSINSDVLLKVVELGHLSCVAATLRMAQRTPVARWGELLCPSCAWGVWRARTPLHTWPSRHSRTAATPSSPSNSSSTTVEC
eukprot:8404472-Alexandrium_andersonii.AAC.1